QLLANHYRDNADNVGLLDDLPSSSGAENLISALLTALSDEGDVLSTAYDRVLQLARDFATLSVTDVIKRIIGILADSVLSSVQVMVDELLRLLAALARTVLDVLTVKIHVPIVSDILNAIGIPDISFLDLFTWIGAAGYTVVYKLASNTAPFPDNGEVGALVSASSWTDLAALFPNHLPNPVGGGSDKLLKSDNYNAAATTTTNRFSITLSEGMQEAVFKEAWRLSLAAGILDLAVASSQGAANVLEPWYPTPNAWRAINYATIASRVPKKVLFCTPAQKQLLKAGPKFDWFRVSDGRAISARFDAGLTVFGLGITVNHLGEMANHPDGNMRNGVILDEVANLASYARGCCTWLPSTPRILKTRRRWLCWSLSQTWYMLEFSSGT
ncbi:hypothetical protein CHU98_g10654, partial [Xylaria longipes]